MPSWYARNAGLEHDLREPGASVRAQRPRPAGIVETHILGLAVDAGERDKDVARGQFCMVQAGRWNRTDDFEPIETIAEAGGPIKVIPACSRALAKPAFSERNP